MSDLIAVAMIVGSAVGFVAFITWNYLTPGL
jgi:hypothetical protein